MVYGAERDMALAVVFMVANMSSAIPSMEQ